jgi:hypothetical protein
MRFGQCMIFIFYALVYGCCWLPSNYCWLLSNDCWLPGNHYLLPSNQIGSIVLHSPLQGIILHDLDSALFPSQSCPFPAGLGLLHVRSLYCFPPPQSSLHFDHEDQSDHPPLTELWFDTVGKGNVFQKCMHKIEKEDRLQVQKFGVYKCISSINGVPFRFPVPHWNCHPQFGLAYA